MKCSDDRIGELLSDYYSGQLPADAWLAVESHVAECDACRRALVVMMTVEGGPARSGYTSGHVAPEQLTKFFRSEPGTPHAEGEAIRRHVDACDICRREYQFLVDLHAELEAAALADPRRASRRFAWRAVATRPIVAWTVVALLAYPALGWLMQRIRPSAEQSYTQVAGPLHRLSEARRGATKTVEVVRAGDQPYFRLAVPMYALPDEMDYRFEFTRTQDRVTLQPQVIANFESKGEIDLLVDAAALADGEYTLLVAETERDTGKRRAVKSYPFTLVTRP